MNITKELVDTILDIKSHDVVDLSAGERILSGSNNQNIVLVLNGSVRYIDNSKSFNSFTIKKEDSPLLIGVPLLLGFHHDEHIVAAENCSIIFLDLNQVGPIIAAELCELAKHKPEPSEYPLIKELLVNNDICNHGDIKSYIDIERDLFAVKDFSSDLHFIKSYLYLDSSSRGFEYGQIVTPEIFDVADGFFELSRTFAFYRRIDSEVQPNALPKSNIDPETPSAIKSGGESTTNRDILSSSLKQSNNNDSKSHKKDSIWLNRLCDNRRDTYALCIERICKMFDIPIRNDSLRKISSYMDKDMINWSEKILPVLDNIGFSCRSINLSGISNAPRFYTPSLWIDSEGNCSLLVKEKLNKILIFDPLKGECLYSQDSLYEKLVHAPTLISIDRGLHAPQNNFNIAWLYPYVKKYKLQFIEIFSASFLNQLFL